METYIQIIANGLMLGALYACIAVGFSLVWGVLNVINMLHGSFIVLGGYLAFFAWAQLGVSPFVMLFVVAAVLFLLGFLIQYGAINRVVSKPVLLTLTLTFGLDLILYNFMNVVFEATPRRITLDLGSLGIGEVMLPYDRLLAMLLALAMTGILYWVLRSSRIGRAIVAVRMDRDAAALMGIRVNKVYAITFGISAMMAGACGALMAVVYPITTNTTGLLLGKAFTICVIGGLGSVPGALVGGLALGLIESFAGTWLGAQYAILIGSLLMLTLLMVRPTGLIGKRGYE
ncbi:branched-chain amino acid ABC transporter permease [Azoarcus indigens]|uniref:Amino acid/amide ABC transporter membrane protein 1 (HAAT family) n=1 Tax=Azoarcus indigens TaxID=29545 RepID=A0A4V3BKV6_9RHOO|nr:branched-chain amino acid ABC transporter permease [Azoarcus indigens]NMG66057.1 branched-chain amino acid ABC transporter permease [Azoarcus indigens]TDN43822.1 amino acid/amide ABC transporter membrane protein 1 (HAAT family) [Azoarcus indigens]